MFVNKCDQDGRYSDWVPGTCSVPCGVGTMTRTRTCTDPAPSGNGKDCFGPDIEQGYPCTVSVNTRH